MVQLIYTLTPLVTIKPTVSLVSPSAFILWGNQAITSGENCDDGNILDGDGWTSTCQIEPGYTCITNGSGYSDWYLWGNGLREGSELWDDHNNDDGDGWSSTCQVESRYSCSGGSPSSADSCSPICGDGFRIGAEACDDGNSDSGDGWSSNWAVENGFEWSGGSSATADTCSSMCGNSILNVGEKCDDGNNIDNDGCSSLWKIEDGWECTTGASKSICSKLSVSETEPEAVAVQTIALVGMAGSAVGSALTMSSPNGVWQTLNFIQLLLLLLLLNAHIPQKIVDFITSTSYFSFSFEIPFVENIFLFSSLLKFFDFGQENPTLEKMGVENGSTLKNIFSQIFILSIVMILHWFAISIRNWDPENSSGKVMKSIKWICKKIWNLLTFTIYIRTALQWSQFMIIASVSEIYNLETKTPPHVISFWIAWITLIFFSLFFLFGTYLWYQRLGNIEYIINSKFEELFSGLKKTNSGISFNLIILLRRGVMISWLIWFSWFPPIIHIISTSLLQFIHLSAVLTIRPFDNVKDNIVESINEGVFFMVLCGFTHFKDASKWSETSTNCYLYLMLFPGILISLISLGIPLITNFRQHLISGGEAPGE
jgi:cysteine-rich repeat protein